MKWDPTNSLRTLYLISFGSSSAAECLGEDMSGRFSEDMLDGDASLRRNDVS